MVKFLSMLLAVAMVFCFACGAVMAEQQTAKEAGEKIVDASKATGKGIGKGTVATGKAVGNTVLNVGTAVVDIGKAVVEQTGNIVKPTAKLGKDAATELEMGGKKEEEKK
jgi:hypothetical protein